MPASRICGRAASASEPALGRELATMARPPAGLHAREHIGGRMGACGAVPGFFVVVQVGVEQGACVVGRLGYAGNRYQINSCQRLL